MFKREAYSGVDASTISSHYNQKIKSQAYSTYRLDVHVIEQMTNLCHLLHLLQVSLKVNAYKLEA